jgi:prepilin-type N-terminal cleavage/methylation domain-containing protein
MIRRILNRPLGAFSLLEMALVLSIIGIVSAYAIPAMLQARVTARYRETEVKFESISYALAGYVLMHGRLPSPADPAELGGACAGTEKQSIQTGILPYRALNIPESEAKDGFRHWISYSASFDAAADPDHLNRDDSSPFCRIRPKKPLYVLNAQGQDVIANNRAMDDLIVFVLVSHGPLGAGAFDDTGKRQAATGDKLRNLGNTPFFTRSVSKEFDDKIHWVTRNNLMAMYAKQPCKQAKRW